MSLYKIRAFALCITSVMFGIVLMDDRIGWRALVLAVLTIFLFCVVIAHDPEDDQHEQAE